MSKNDKIISGITLEIKKGQFTTLSIEEARQLYNELEELFGDRVVWKYPDYTPVIPTTDPYVFRSGTNVDPFDNGVKLTC